MALPGHWGLGIAHPVIPRAFPRAWRVRILPELRGPGLRCPWGTHRAVQLALATHGHEEPAGHPEDAHHTPLHRRELQQACGEGAGHLGKGTLRPRRPLSRLRGPRTPISGAGVKGPGFSGAGRPQGAREQPGVRGAWAPVPLLRAPRARPQPGRESRAPWGARGCAARPVPTGEGDGIRHPEPRLPRAGRRGRARGVRAAGPRGGARSPAFAPPSPRAAGARASARRGTGAGPGARGRRAALGGPGPPPHSLSPVSACTPPMRPSRSTWRWKPMPTLQ